MTETRTRATDIALGALMLLGIYAWCAGLTWLVLVCAAGIATLAVMT